MKKYLILSVIMLIAQLGVAQEAHITLNTPQPANTTAEATQSIRLLPGFVGVPTFIGRIVEEGEINVVIENPYNLNENLNWISSSTYDLSGQLTSAGISYFNILGKATQSHSLDIKTGKIWANEIRYDIFGRPVFSSLSAPVGDTYGYRDTFISKTDGNAITDIDIANILDNTASAIIGNQENTLGWYYSDQNDSEPYQDITGHPYTKSVYSTLNPGNVLQTLGGNKVKRTPASTEEWVQSYSFSMPMAQELFYAFGKDYFPERALVVGTPIATDINQLQDNLYYIYSMVKCGEAEPINDVVFAENYILEIGRTYNIVYDGEIGYYTITGRTLEIDGPCSEPPCDQEDDDPTDDLGAFLASTNTYDSCPYGKPYYLLGKKTVVRDVHGIESVVFEDSEGNVLAAARSGNEAGTTKEYPVISPIGPQGYVDIHIPVGCSNASVLGPDDARFDVYDLISENKIYSATELRTLSLAPGMYRIQEVLSQYHESAHAYATINVDGSLRMLDDTSQVGVSYNVNYYDYSLNFYDKANRLVNSIQPLGFDDTLNLTDTGRNHSLASSFTYNTLGQLQNTTSPDEGYAEFTYRKDGQIRFSQNSKQQTTGEFSYTNYDALGCPMESGVCTGTFSSLDPDVTGFSGTRKEQHFTLYDVPDTDLAATLAAGGFGEAVYGYQQRFVAGNVSKTYTQNPATTTTWYSYDAYGRVEWMIQNIEGLGIKTIDYDYDFATGQVNKVQYQKYFDDDRFVHKYTYNVAGELIKVETSTDNLNFTEHARYLYYETGALKRVELAENVQGTDYIYNLAGQLKAINHPSTNSADDPGKDGSINNFARDLFGFAVDYYDGDYRRSNTPTPVVTSVQGTNQFNGNIKATRWATSQINNTTQAGQLYNYNKNNWLQQADFGTALNNGQITVGADYQVSGITYDANGNIQTLKRNKHTENGSNAMDDFTYHYKPGKPNQLDHVDDAVAGTTNADDLKDQNTGNYVYNAIGQLIENVEEGIKYTYNASGLVTEIQKNNVPLVKFLYDDKGHRVKKESYTAGSLTKTEYYVRDASGTPMAIYEGTVQTELPIYGASRLGVHKKQTGTNLYQLTDHLGNVRAVIAKDDNGNAAALVSATDYYPFGMPMPGRSLSGAEGYRYAYQGQEKDPETGKEAFQLRLWDSRIGRWLTTDPYGQFHSPYLGMGNNPMNGTDPDGGKFFDWFRDQNGNLKWFDNGSEGFSDSDGNTWTNTNYGDELLQFDGKNLIYSIQTGNIIDGFELKQYKYSADSGVPILLDTENPKQKQFFFSYSEERQLTPNVGPTPEGNYHVFKDKVQIWNNLSGWDKLKSNAGGGKWPGGTKSWGNFRFEIYPKSVTLNGGIIRGDFFLHGGDIPGSRGCIDLCNKIDEFYSDFMKGAQNKVHLLVHYDYN